MTQQTKQYNEQDIVRTPDGIGLVIDTSWGWIKVDLGDGHEKSYRSKDLEMVESVQGREQSNAAIKEAENRNLAQADGSWYDGSTEHLPLDDRDRDLVHGEVYEIDEAGTWASWDANTETFNHGAKMTDPDSLDITPIHVDTSDAKVVDMNEGIEQPLQKRWDEAMAQNVGVATLIEMFTEDEMMDIAAFVSDEDWGVLASALQLLEDREKSAGTTGVLDGISEQQGASAEESEEAAAAAQQHDRHLLESFENLIAEHQDANPAPFVAMSFTISALQRLHKLVHEDLQPIIRDAARLLTEDEKVRLFFDLSRYEEGLGKTESGRPTVDIDDLVADYLRVPSMQGQYERAAAALDRARTHLQELEHEGANELGNELSAKGCSVDRLKAAYGHLNHGMQRMNIGNRVRGAVGMLRSAGCSDLEIERVITGTK